MTAARPARRVEEAVVGVVDAEVAGAAGRVDVRHEHQGRIVQAVGQVHRARRRAGSRPAAVGSPRGDAYDLKGVRAQLGERLDLAHRPAAAAGPAAAGQPISRTPWIAAAGAGGHGDPAAVGVQLGVPDGGQPGLVRARRSTGSPLGERAAGHGGHAGRDVPPAFGLRGGEARAARPASASRRSPAAQIGHGHRAQRAERVLQQGVGDGLGVGGAPAPRSRRRAAAPPRSRLPPDRRGRPRYARRGRPPATSESGPGPPG